MTGRPHGVILAAGAGRRLARAVDGSKVLTSVGGSPVLAALLAQIVPRSARVVVAVPARSDVAEALRSWATPTVEVLELAPAPPTDTGTLSACIDAIGSIPDNGLVIADGDLVVDDTVLDRVFSSSVTGVIVDPFRSAAAMDMRASTCNGRLVALGKDLLDEQSDAEFVGLTRIRSADVPSFRRHLDAVLDRGRATASGSYEDAITMLRDDRTVAAIATPGPGLWADIDTPADLERAESIVTDLRRR